MAPDGQGWPAESQPFCRMPDRAQTVVRPLLWELSRLSAGLNVRFRSDSALIAARWSLLNEDLGSSHMAPTGVSGLDLYARDEDIWRWAGVGRPAQIEGNRAILLDAESAAPREYLLYLPLYNGTRELSIGVNGSFELITDEARRPICFYGTSIVQGACASRAGMAYPAILGRWLDWPALNLGFSGNSRAEPEVAELLAELDPAIYVLDPLPNLRAPAVAALMGGFVETLRAARPKTPIVLVGNILYCNAWIKPSERQRQIESNDALRVVYQNLLAASVGDLHLVEGQSLLGDDGEATVDGTHPTDVGFQRIARALLPLLQTLLETHRR